MSNAAVSSIDLDADDASLRTWSNIGLSDCDVNVVFGLPSNYEPMEFRSRISCLEGSKSGVVEGGLKLYFSDSDVSCDLGEASEIKTLKQMASFMRIGSDLVMEETQSVHRPFSCDDAPKSGRRRVASTPQRRVERTVSIPQPASPQPIRRRDADLRPNAAARIRRSFQGLTTVPVGRLGVALGELGLLDDEILKGLSSCRSRTGEWDAEKVKYRLIAAVVDGRSQRFDSSVRQRLENVPIVGVPRRARTPRRALVPVERNLGAGAAIIKCRSPHVASRAPRACGVYVSSP